MIGMFWIRKWYNLIYIFRRSCWQLCDEYIDNKEAPLWMQEEQSIEVVQVRDSVTWIRVVMMEIERSDQLGIHLEDETCKTSW